MRTMLSSSLALRTAMVAALCLALGRVALAQTTKPQSQPVATAPVEAAGIERLQVTVTAVQNLAYYRVPPGQWKKCVVGMVLDEGAEFRTGPDSAVQFTLPPDQTITLDRLGVVKLLDAIRQKGKIIADYQMLHGRVRLEIESHGVEHQSEIRSPNGSLSVRGTVVSLYDQGPFPVEAISLTGRAQFASRKSRTAFGGKGAGKTVVAPGKSAADVLLANAVVDPSISEARVPEERALLADVISRGSTVSFQLGGIPIVSGGTPPVTDRQLSPFQLGALEFVLRWKGNADLNLGVADPNGRFMIPVTGLNTTRSGGFIPFNNIGGPHGGIEIGYWSKFFPAGFYSAFVQFVSGNVTSYTLDVFLNGKRTAILVPPSSQVATLNGTAGPNMNELVSVPINLPIPPTPSRKAHPDPKNHIPANESSGNKALSRNEDTAHGHNAAPSPTPRGR